MTTTAIDALPAEESSHPPSWAVRRLRLLLDSDAPAESATLLDAVHDVSELSLPNTSAAKRDLMRILQRRAVQRSAEVLATFNAAQNALRTVRSEVASMENDLSSLSTRLSGARTAASDIVEQTADLRARATSAARRRVVCVSFADRFVLTESETAALKGEIVNAAFLAALKRVEHIHAQSRVLLRAHSQRAGLEALEMAATTREEAYEKVFRFVHKECGTLDVDADEREEDAALLRNAIRALRARPALLRSCAEEVGSARRASLVSRFVRALTHGGPGGMPRPIELHAHDPMRYTNDMLAWIHQALASEKELVARLFTADVGDLGKEDGPSEDAAREHNELLALKVLNTVFDALCRPFRIRFEQALETPQPVVILYRVASVLEFYAHMMEKLLGTKTAFAETLMECNTLAMYAFFSAWKAKMESFHSSGAGPADTLLPPQAVHQSMTRLDEIMATLDASMVPEDARAAHISAVLEVIVTPLVSLCERMSATALSPVDQRIFLANCFESMRAPLAVYGFAADRVQRLASAADASIDEYIALSTTIVLRRCGLADRVRILREHGMNSEQKPPLSRVPGMDTESLAIAVKNFYAMLFGGSVLGSIDALQPPSVAKISNVRARHRAQLAVARNIATAHAELHAAVLDEDNFYGQDAAVAVGLRDPAKIELILTNGCSR